jgi:hypothetical protein
MAVTNHCLESLKDVTVLATWSEKTHDSFGITYFAMGASTRRSSKIKLRGDVCLLFNETKTLALFMATEMSACILKVTIANHPPLSSTRCIPLTYIDNNPE